jgi:hypothetical protein
VVARAYSVDSIPESWTDQGKRVTITHDGLPLITGRLNVVIGRVLWLDLDTADGTTLPTRVEVPVGAVVEAAG